MLDYADLFERKKYSTPKSAVKFYDDVVAVTRYMDFEARTVVGGMYYGWASDLMKETSRGGIRRD